MLRAIQASPCVQCRVECACRVGETLEVAFAYHEAHCPYQTSRRSDAVAVYPWQTRTIGDADLARAVELMEEGASLWTVADDLRQPPSLVFRLLADYQRRMANTVFRQTGYQMGTPNS